MTTSLTLRATKGAALTHDEMDANLTALQTTADAAAASAATLTADKANASAVGIANTDTNIGSFTGTTISNNGTVKAGMQELETAVETKANASALGVTSSAANMGTYTGTTISDNQTAKQNLQEIETAVEARPTSATLAATGGAALIGGNDGSSGSLWTTLQGFVNYLLSSAGSAIVGFIQSGTGAVAETAQTALRRVVWDKQFGCVGDGTTDDTTALTNFLNSAIANPGVPHFVRPLTYKITGTLPTINASGVWVEGAGSEIHDVGSSLMTGTVFKYAGTATATPLVTITSVSGASNQRVANVRFKGIGFDCNTGSCDYALAVNSVMRCDIDVAVANAAVAGVVMNVVASLGETKDNQYNRITLRLREVETSGYGLSIGGDASANTSFNEFWVDAQHYDGAAILCSNSDNNDWRVVRCYMTGGGSATECISLLGSNTAAGSASREERFWALTCNTAVHVYGTGTYTYPSINHQIFALDSDNSSTAPTVDAGASLHWRYAKAALDDEAWTTFTPTIAASTGTLTTVTGQSGYYRKFGKRVDFKLSFTITTNGTGATALTATLPVTASATATGSIATGMELNATSKLLSGFIGASATTVILRYYDGTYPGLDTGVYTVSGSYEVAS